MGFIKRISKQRNEHILRKAEPFTSEEEEVAGWVRARHPDDGRRGIFYITEERCIVHWSGRKDGHAAHEWRHVQDWDLDRSSKGGPTLRIETEDEITHVQLVVSTKEMAATLREFLQVFAEVAPWPPDAALDPEGVPTRAPHEHGELKPHRRTPPEMAKRVILTVIGIALIVIGIAIIPLPGPWSFVLNIAGLAILAREYDWADDLLDWSKEKFAQAKKKVTGRNRTSS